MKSSELVFLFTSEWYEIMYDKRRKAFDFVVCDRPPKLSDDTNMFAATIGLAYPMCVAFVQGARSKCLSVCVWGAKEERVDEN